MSVSLYRYEWLDEYHWDLVDMGDTGWYWHLHWKGKRINGGLSPNEERADHCAHNAAIHHHFHEWGHTYQGRAQPS